MKSTGEVMGLDHSFERAFAKSQLGAGVKLPMRGTAFISVRDADKGAAVTLARRLTEMGFSLMATRGTAARLREAGPGFAGGGSEERRVGEGWRTRWSAAHLKK